MPSVKVCIQTRNACQVIYRDNVYERALLGKYFAPNILSIIVPHVSDGITGTNLPPGVISMFIQNVCDIIYPSLLM